MTDDIIEAAARALQGVNFNDWQPEAAAYVMLLAVTPLIRAAVLEEAAKVAEGFTCGFCDKKSSNYLASGIRSLKE